MRSFPAEHSDHRICAIHFAHMSEPRRTMPIRHSPLRSAGTADHNSPCLIGRRPRQLAPTERQRRLWAPQLASGEKGWGATGPPDADRDWVVKHLEPLRLLGTKRDRRDALEIPLFEGLRSRLSRYGFRVDLWSEHFHGVCNDITVIGCTPAGRLIMFNLEVRNRRSHLHDVLARVDARAIERDQRIGVTTAFVVPRCTRRFRREVESRGAVVIETGVYVVTTDEQKAMLDGLSWMAWPVELGSRAAPRIAEQVAELITAGLEPIEGPVTVIEQIPADAAAEVAEVLRVEASRERVERALELHGAGVTTMADAATAIGVSRSTLQRAFQDTGTSSQWRHRGAREGSGRKPRALI